MFLNIGFCYEWWNSQYGLRFGKEFHFDQDRKIAQLLFMDQAMRKRFPWSNELMPEMQNISDINMNIEPFGHRFVPALFGCEVAYSDANSPWAVEHILTPAEIETMPFWTMDEFSRDEKVKTIAEQTSYVRQKYGRCSSQQNLGSVINTAIYLRGMELFTDFFERPELVHRLYALITNRMMLAYEYCSQLDGKPADTGVGNCSVCMLSPQIYQDFNRKYDMQIMELARSKGVCFGIHQDSDVTSFIDAYRPFDYLFGFDIGFDTNIALFRKAFPRIPLNICLYTSFLNDRTPGEIEKDILKLAVDGGDPDLTGFTCVDIDSNVPDEKVTALCEAVRSVWS